LLSCIFIFDAVTVIPEPPVKVDLKVQGVVATSDLSTSQRAPAAEAQELLSSGARVTLEGTLGRRAIGLDPGKLEQQLQALVSTCCFPPTSFHLLGFSKTPNFSPSNF
jgi:hypothetical protein